MNRNRVALAGLLLFEAWGTLYRLGQVWGSTAAERSQVLPGDDIVPGAKFVTDHAVTMNAPAADVWPWLLQVGWHRGGWYTARWVDILLFPDNRPSAERILPEYQGLRVGDKIPDGAPETGCFFVVEELRARELMVLHSWTHLPAAFRESGRGSIDWTWTFALSEVSEGRTRFHFRVRGRLRPWWLEALYHLTLVPADFIMSRSLCRGLKRRAESLAEQGAGGRPQPETRTP